MLGFGAALTGATAWLMAKHMDPAQRTQLLDELFAPPPEGIGLSLLRVPVGTSDLSPDRFSLAPVPPSDADGTVKLDLAPIMGTSVPVLHDILKVRPGTRIIASPWSPPAWMKTSGSMIGGQLLRSQEANFARYLAEYVQAMKAMDIPIFALTLQNEPDFTPHNYPGMKMGAAQRARVIADDLGPLLAREHSDTAILDWDDNWDQYWQPLQVLADPAASKYVLGVAWHCYEGKVGAQDLVHARYPDKLALLTECSDGLWAPNDQESIAGFVRQVFVQPIRHWDAGVILWSLALDAHHGPHDGGCDKCIGVVTIHRDSGRVERTRDYYALAHFSAFVGTDAYRIGSSVPGGGLSDVGFIDPRTHTLALVVTNSNASARRVRIELGTRHAVVTVPARSVATVQFGHVTT